MKNKIFFIFFFFTDFLICKDYSFDNLNSDENKLLQKKKEKNNLKKISYLPFFQNLKNNVGVTKNNFVKKTEKNKNENISSYNSSSDLTDDLAYLDNVFEYNYDYSGDYNDY